MRIPDQNFVCDSCGRILVGKLDDDVASRRLAATPADVEDDVVAGVVVALGRLLVLFLVGVELKDGSRPGAGVSANKLRRPDHFG